MIRKQITVCLKNRPGALAKATQTVAKANVNVEAITVAENSDLGIVRMVVSDVDAAARAMDGLGIACIVEKVAVFQIDNHPGGLASFAAKASHNGISIHYLYGSAATGAPGSKGLVVVSSSDLEGIEALWG